MPNIRTLIRQFDSHCHYCDCRVIVATPATPFHATADHYIPKARGGGNENNLVLCCTGCNGAKGDMTGREFFEFIRTGRLPDSYVTYLSEKIRLRMRAYKPARQETAPLLSP